MQVNTFIIGVQKAGTTSMYEWLIQHPEICGEIFLKEYPFFTNDDLYHQGTEVLESQFKCSTEPIRISGCVDYFQDEIGLDRIKKYAPEAKLILILREPLDRIRSAHRFLIQLGKEEHKDLNIAVRKDPEYLNRSLYADSLKTLYKHFNKAQVKVVLFEKMAQHPQYVLKEIYDFLEVDPNFYAKTFTANKTEEARFKAVNRLLYSDNKNTLFRKVARAILPPALRVKFRRAIRSANTKKSLVSADKPTVSEEITKQLEADIAELKNHLDLEGYW